MRVGWSVEGLEVVRVEVGVSTARFCQLFDMPEWAWHRWQVKGAHWGTWQGSLATTGSAGCQGVSPEACAGSSGVGGHRKIWAIVRHDGHVFSEASVLRILREEGLILLVEYQRRGVGSLSNARSRSLPSPAERTRSGDWTSARSRPPSAGPGGMPGLLVQVRTFLPLLARR